MDREQALFRLFGKYCPEGTILATEGSPGQEMYVIQSGAVRVGATHPQGGPARVLGPGELLGEGSFYSRAPPAAKAEVVQDARLIQVSDRTLDAVVRHGPQTAQVIFDRLLSLAEDAGRDLTLWSVGQLLLRVAPGLIETAVRGVAAADLAEDAGVSESDALLVLEELRRRGCLTREGSGYRAADAARLRREIDGLTAARGGT